MRRGRGSSREGGLVWTWESDGGGRGGFTSAVLGTDSQNISIFMSPWFVWSVTDIVVGVVMGEEEEKI